MPQSYKGVFTLGCSQLIQGRASLTEGLKLLDELKVAPHPTLWREHFHRVREDQSQHGGWGKLPEQRPSLRLQPHSLFNTLLTQSFIPEAPLGWAFVQKGLSTNTPTTAQQMPFGVPQKQVWLISCASPCLQHMKPKVSRGPCASSIGVALSEHSLKTVFKLEWKTGEEKEKRVCWDQSCFEIHRARLSEPATMKSSNCHAGSLHPQRGNFFLCLQENFFLKRGANWGRFVTFLSPPVYLRTCWATALFQ